MAAMILRTARTARTASPARTARRGRRRVLALGLGAALAVGATSVSAPATAVVPTSPCTATVHVDSAWGASQDWAGAVLTVTVTNPASTPSTTWTATARMAEGQSVGAIWNARSVGSGVSLVARDDGNGALAPNASTTFGVYLRGGSQVPAFTCTSDAPRPAGDTVVTETDNGRTVGVLLGDTVTVRLGKDWLPPTVAGDGLQLVSVTGGYPSGAAVEAVYRARWSSGPTVLRSQTDYDCLHTPPLCARPTQGWSVTVQILVPPPAAG